MSKKLKKRIRQLCGIDGLSKDERAKRCKEILYDVEFKTKLCNSNPGMSFKDIERTILDFANEKSVKKPEDEMYDDLERDHPYKLGLEEPEEEPILPPLPKKGKRIKMVYLSRQDVIDLNADEGILNREEEKPKSFDTNYPTYTLTEVLELLKASS